MDKNEKLEIIMNEGFTEFQARVIYDEMGCENIDRCGFWVGGFWKVARNK